MPSRPGAQRASRRTRSVQSFAFTLSAVFLLALVGVGVTSVLRPAPVLAGSSAAGLKAVFIVGPASGSTSEYIDQANAMAAQAAAEGMNVVKIFTPNAYWSTVKSRAQNANLLVYFGHGNGFPNPYRTDLYEDTEDGFGLNPEGTSHGSTSPTEYHGANDVRAALHLADHAVVVLYRLCYASGNAESGMRAMSPSSTADRQTAFKRVDNFAAGFLHIGAGAVFALGWPQKINLPQQLAETDRSMDKIFEDRANNTGSPNAFIGTHDYRVASNRTNGAWLHLDPHPSYGYLRALTGDLEMTAAQWRGDAAPPDHTAPDLSGVGAATTGASGSMDDGSAAFSPNGDGVDDQLVLNRTVSESATIETTISDAAGAVVNDIIEPTGDGPGTTTWDGTDATGARVPDGAYTVRMTATDKAGNISTPDSIPVHVLTALGAPSASVPAIETRDGDALASSVRFDATLASPASIGWKIVDATGNVVVTGPEDRAAVPGELLWNWNGTDTSGSAVHDGTYRAVVTATTDAGTISYGRSVYVGAYQVQLSAISLQRGQKVKIIVANTELLTNPPVLTIAQTGLAPYSVTLKKISDHRYSLTFTLASGGSAGRSTWTISGSDVNGGPETMTFTRRLR